MTTMLRTVIALVLALAAVGCNGDGGDGDPTEAATTAPDATETQAGDGDTESPPVEASTPAPDDETGAPDGTDTEAVDQVDFTQASVTIDATGAFERSVTLDTVIGAQYGGDQPNVLISVIESSDTPTATWNLVFPIGTTTAEIDDTGDIYLAYTMQDDAGTEHVFFNIEPGSCSITVEEATPEGVSGTWECPQNVATDDPDVVIDASGTFSAAP